ncbi:MAG: 5-oxoprolinase subunit PxpB [Pseudomonadota bacterium]
MLTRIADDQFSIDAESAPFAQALADHLRVSGAWLDVVPGINSVVVQFDAGRTKADDAERLIDVAYADFEYRPTDDGPLIEIPVRYGGEDGPDLEPLCADLGISKTEFIEQHTGQAYPVEMVGFTPGFAFIGGLPTSLHAPRRSAPRQQVPAGSVAVADSRTGLYALASPGGWNLVGRTDMTLFDPHGEDPFPISPGMRVRFVAR